MQCLIQEYYILIYCTSTTNNYRICTLCNANEKDLLGLDIFLALIYITKAQCTLKFTSSNKEKKLRELKNFADGRTNIFLHRGFFFLFSNKLEILGTNIKSKKHC